MSRLFYIILLFLAHSSVNAQNDVFTLEALMSLHKATSKAEKSALREIELSVVETENIKQKTNAYHKVKSVLETRTTDAHNTIFLAAQLALVGKELYLLIKEYANFTSSTTASLFRKPQCAWYYVQALSECKREIQNMQAMMVRLGATEINLLKATTDKKLMLVSTLQNYIIKCRYILNRAFMWCSYVVNNGLHRLFISDIFTSSITDDIVKRVANAYKESSN